MKYFYVKSLKCGIYFTLNSTKQFELTTLEILSSYMWLVDTTFDSTALQRCVLICTRIYVQNVNYRFKTYLFFNALGLCCVHRLSLVVAGRFLTTGLPGKTHYRFSKLPKSINIITMV